MSLPGSLLRRAISSLRSPRAIRDSFHPAFVSVLEKTTGDVVHGIRILSRAVVRPVAGHLLVGDAHHDVGADLLQ